MNYYYYPELCVVWWNLNWKKKLHGEPWFLFHRNSLKYKKYPKLSNSLSSGSATPNTVFCLFSNSDTFFLIVSSPSRISWTYTEKKIYYCDNYVSLRKLCKSKPYRLQFKKQKCNLCWITDVTRSQVSINRVWR